MCHPLDFQDRMLVEDISSASRLDQDRAAQTVMLPAQLPAPHQADSAVISIPHHGYPRLDLRHLLSETERFILEVFEGEQSDSLCLLLSLFTSRAPGLTEVCRPCGPAFLRTFTC
jgi:hypothetical protein